MKTVDAAAYKTITQIEAETTGVKYVRPIDYARILALTEFLRELEKEHGENFRLTIAHPSLFENRKMDSSSRIFGIGLSANFVIGNVRYHLTMDENLFFPVHLSKSWRVSDRVDQSPKTWGLDVCDIVYAGWEGKSTPEDIKRLTANMHTALNVVESHDAHLHRNEIPPYCSNEKQTIYWGV